MRLGIDVGGTFTDFILADERQGAFFSTKTPTTHHDLAEGVLQGLTEILQLGGISVGGIDYIVHGTTIGTNAIVEAKGAKVGLMTTAGFEDVLEIRRVARPKEAAFDFGADNPPPLVPRYLRKGIIERIDKKGEVLLPLEEGSVEEAVEYFREKNIEAIAVSLLFSFLNPAHEHRIAEICRERLPDVPVSLSSEICPEFREYERTCTTVMNSYLGPVIKRYMSHLTEQLERNYGGIRLHIMQSNGGSMSAEMAGNHASQLINSGPAAGAIAAAFISKLANHDKAVGADMGGTTLDISIIDKGMPKTTTWGGVTEYPIKLPMVELNTIGAGGGSIAWVDQGGVLYVGPQSAGSDPGPACYGWGGALPTVSDANLVLGRLNPNYFLGGKIPLFLQKAHTAIKEQVAGRMGLSVEEAALSIIKIANANMVKGISEISVEKGYDLREFILVPFGGAAPNHAVEIAADLGIAKTVVPPMSGNLSALGLVVTDIEHDLVRTLAMKHYDVSPELLFSTFREMEEQGMRQLREESVRDEDIYMNWSADLRYEGQSWELNTPIPRFNSFGEKQINDMVSRFHSLHQQVYSYSQPGETIEFINLRVKAVGRNPRLTLEDIPRRPVPLAEALKEKRPVCFEEKGFVEVPVYEREKLGCGTEIVGPCIIEEKISTTFLPFGSRADIDGYGNIVIIPANP
jgi:N-methylhydantoinase A